MKEEENRKIQSLKENQRKYFSTLAKQVKEKENALLRENEIQKSFVDKHFENIKQIEQKEKKKKEQKLQKIKEEKERMLSLSIGNESLI